MPRPRKWRRVCNLPEISEFGPKNTSVDNNEFIIETTLLGQNIILKPAGNYVDIQSNLKAG